MIEQKVDIVLISYNTCQLTLDCIKSIYETAEELVSNIIVVDNASTDSSLKKIKESYPKVRIKANTENFGYAKAVNIGVKDCSSELIIVSNTDVVFLKDSINKLISTFEISKDCGVCGPRQIFPDNSPQRSYGNLPGTKLGVKDLLLITHINNYFYKKFPITEMKEVEYIDGAVMLIKKSVFDSVGGFDEDYFFYTEEADFCHRVKKSGFKVIHNPKSVVIHYRGATEEKNVSEKRIEMLISTKGLFCKKHLGFINAKIFMIFELFYSYNMVFIHLLLGILRFSIDKKNITTFKYFGKYWSIEFLKLMKENDE